MAEDLDIPDNFAAPDPSPPSDAKLCAAPGCETFFVPTGPGKAWAKYCPEHKAPPKPKGVKRDRKPSNVSVSVNLGARKGSAKGAELDKVKERAEQLANMVALLVRLAGQVEDADDIVKGASPWAESVKQLAVHEEWLRKIAQGGETTERAMAWIAFVISTATLALPILVRHNVLPGELGDLALQAMGETQVVEVPAAVA